MARLEQDVVEGEGQRPGRGFDDFGHCRSLNVKLGVPTRLPAPRLESRPFMIGAGW
jgi:hypothetical protein